MTVGKRWGNGKQPDSLVWDWMSVFLRIVGALFSPCAASEFVSVLLSLVDGRVDMEVDAQVLVHGHSCSRIVVGRGVVRSGEQRDESAICEELGTILDHLKIRDNYSFQKSKQKLDLMSTNDHVYVQLTADVGHHVLAKQHACSSGKFCKN